MPRLTACSSCPNHLIRLPAAVLCAVLLLAFTACGLENPPPAAGEVLTAMMTALADAAAPLPAGQIFLRPETTIGEAADRGEGSTADAATATEPGTAPLTDPLLSALFGPSVLPLLEETVGPDGQAGAPPVGDVAIYLSLTAHPGELAVFRCSDRTAAMAAAKLCRARLDTIRRAWRGTAYEAITEAATVTLEGNYVLLLVTEDPAAAGKACRALLNR